MGSSHTHAMFHLFFFSETCYNSSSGDGRGYRGTLNYTEKGVLCQPWNERWPHDPRERELALSRREGLGRHNNCRNPMGRRSRPWCYTTLKRPTWQYCDIVLCNQRIRTDGDDTWNKCNCSMTKKMYWYVSAWGAPFPHSVVAPG